MVHYKKLKFKTKYFWCINTDRTTLQNLQMDCLHNLCPPKSIHPQQIFCSNERKVTILYRVIKYIKITKRNMHETKNSYFQHYGDISVHAFYFSFHKLGNQLVTQKF